MDIALKKLELIEWLTRLQDEKSIEQVEALRKSMASKSYELRMPKPEMELSVKFIRSEQDQKEGRVHTQQEIEKIVRAKFDK